MAAIEISDPEHLRFKLKKPWPDFLIFYGSATGAGWIVPKKYLEKVGEDGFKKAPIGAGPYKFVSFNPGVELVLESFDQYWRKSPVVKRLVLKVIPDETTRLAALKRGEVDVVDPRRAGRRATKHAGAHAQADTRPRGFPSGLSGSVGPEITLA